MNDILIESPGRGPTGKLRNFKSMSPEKLAGVIADLEDYARDTEALNEALAVAGRPAVVAALGSAEPNPNFPFPEPPWPNAASTSPVPAPEGLTGAVWSNISRLAMNSDTAASVEEATRGRDAIIEPKFDGIRLLVNVTEDGVRMYARSGNSKSGKLIEIEEELRNLAPGTWLDCEAVAFNENGTQDWGGAQSALGSDAPSKAVRDRIRLVVFDLLASGGIDARMEPLRNRREILELLFSHNDFERIVISPAMPATAESHEANLEFGYEGSMVKLLDAPYQSGKRSKSSVKLKAVDTVDCVITGYKPGEPGSWIDRAGLIGAIKFEHYEDGKPIEGKCSGMTVRERERITASQAALLGTVLEVGYMTRMPGGKLRHPQFRKLRDDKTAEQCRA